MNHIRRLAVLLAGVATTALAFVANATAAFAWPDPPLRCPSIWFPPQRTPAITRTVVTGGMPGWQIALIAAGAALVAAALAVLADRIRSARRRETAGAASAMTAATPASAAVHPAGRPAQPFRQRVPDVRPLAMPWPCRPATPASPAAAVGPDSSPAQKRAHDHDR